MTSIQFALSAATRQTLFVTAVLHAQAFPPGQSWPWGLNFTAKFLQQDQTAFWPTAV